MLTVTVSDIVTEASVTVRVAGEVDMSSAPVVAEALEKGCAEASRSSSLVVDLTGIRFFAAAGLALLLTVRQRCLDRQVPLLVVAPDSVLRPLRIAGLDGLFDIVPPVDVHTAPVSRR